MSRTYLAVIDEGSGVARPATDSDVLTLSPSAAKETLAPLDLYVTTDGNDMSGDGSVSSPFRTTQAAVNLVERTKIRHPVTINLGPGTFSGAYLSGIDVSYPVNSSAGAWLEIVGTLATATESGLMTGTVTSGTAGSSAVWATMTKADAGWTPSALRGKFVLYKSGTSATTTPVCIEDNTADTITLAGTTVAGAPDTTTVFEILDCATTINSGPVRPKLTSNPGGITTTQYGFITDGGSISYSVSLIQIRNIRFDGIRAAYHAGSAPILFGRCQVLNTPANAQAFYSATHQAGTLQLTGCYYTSSASGTAVAYVAGPVSILSSVMSGASGNKGYVDSASASYSFSAGTTISSSSMTGFGTAVQLTGTPKLALGARISNCGVGIDASACSSGGCYISISTGAIFTNCTTALKVRRPNAYASIVGTVSGTGNTTAVEAAMGAQVCIASTVTLTGTTELSVDGSAFTLAAMRSASPKYCTNATIDITGTKVFED